MKNQLHTSRGTPIINTGLKQRHTASYVSLCALTERFQNLPSIIFADVHSLKRPVSTHTSLRPQSVVQYTSKS